MVTLGQYSAMNKYMFTPSELKSNEYLAENLPARMRTFWWFGFFRVTTWYKVGSVAAA